MTDHICGGKCAEIRRDARVMAGVQDFAVYTCFMNRGLAEVNHTESDGTPVFAFTEEGLDALTG